MIKTLTKAQKMEREKFRIPRSVQDAIPIRRLFADGIFQVGNQYSKTWSFTDINYAIASKEDKMAMFLDYSELLNALDSGASAKITIYNRRINKAEFERGVLLPDKADGLDEYRHEFNRMLTAQVTGTSNSIVRERYLTVSVVKRNADEARSYFARVGTDLVTHLAQLSSVANELTLNERLHIFRDFFKAGEQAAAEFNIHEHAKRGQHFKDWFCPDCMEFAADHFKIDTRYGRVLYLQDYASYIKDSFVSELCDLDRDLMLSIDILPVPTDEAARQLQSTLLGIETNVTNWQRRQNANNNFTATIPYDMELQRKETKEMLDDLTTKGVSEPYRMFTSRAEYRLSLREDNADVRLTPTAHDLGLISDAQWKFFCEKQEHIAKESERLKSTWIHPTDLKEGEAIRVFGVPIEHEYSLKNLLSRPSVTYQKLMTLELADGTHVGDASPAITPDEAEQIEVGVKYAGYISRQQGEIEKNLRNETTRIPSDLDYDSVHGLSFEVREKLKEYRPGTIGQASRISGVTPAAISLLIIFLSKSKREREGANAE